MLASYFVLALASLAVLGAADPARHDGSGPQSETQVDFAGLAQEFLETNELSPDGKTFLEILSGPAFVGVPLGGFELHVPVVSLRDQEAAAAFEDVSKLLIDLQEVWFAWRSTETDVDPIAADWKRLKKWVGTWSPKKLAKLEGAPESVYDQLKADDKVREAQARLREHTRPPAETIEAVGDLNVMVLAPTRKDFLQLVGVGGLVDEQSRVTLWTDNMIFGAAAWVGWTEIVALQYPKPPIDVAHAFEGAPMTQRDETGLLQYLADRAGALLLRKEFWRHGTHFFEEALGTNLVISAVGRNGLKPGEWKLEYKTSGARTDPYERFVPGGNPGGGLLPPRKAGPGNLTTSGSHESSYRADAGEEYFVKSLRKGQKDGNKLVDKDNPLRKDKSAHFALYAPETRGKTTITAPFLGAPALDKALPPHEYLDDYEDFFRAYRSSFLHWLRQHGAGKPDESAALFARLIDKQATRATGAPPYTIFAEIYGVPMSAVDGSVDSLEWRFLAWLQRGK